MSESTAALVAALVGAAAAVLVGGLALYAALKQVSRAAVTQREQAFWELRRDAYARVLVASRGFERVAWEFREASQDQAVDTLGELVKELDDAAHVFEEARAVMDISVPWEAPPAHALRNYDSYVMDVVQVVGYWASGMPNPDGWPDRYESPLLRLNELGGELADALRDDLAKDVEPATRSGRTLRDRVCGRRPRSR